MTEGMAATPFVGSAAAVAVSVSGPAITSDQPESQADEDGEKQKAKEEGSKQDQPYCEQSYSNESERVHDRLIWFWKLIKGSFR